VVAFHFSADAIQESDHFFHEEYFFIISLTVRETLDEQLAEQAGVMACRKL